MKGKVIPLFTPYTPPGEYARYSKAAVKMVVAILRTTAAASTPHSSPEAERDALLSLLDAVHLELQISDSDRELYCFTTPT